MSITFLYDGTGIIRWEREEFYIDIVENTELAHIAPSEDEAVRALIELLDVY